MAYAAGSHRCPHCGADWQCIPIKAYGYCELDGPERPCPSCQFTYRITNGKKGAME